MNNTRTLTREQFQDILLEFHKKGVEAEKVNISEFINEIILQMTLAIDQTSYENIDSKK